MYNSTELYETSGKVTAGRLDLPINSQTMQLLSEAEISRDYWRRLLAKAKKDSLAGRCIPMTQIKKEFGVS